ncbi:MAG: hypothetical protein ABIX12_02955 [Rubrivivax sp.]
MTLGLPEHLRKGDSSVASPPAMRVQAMPAPISTRQPAPSDGNSCSPETVLHASAGKRAPADILVDSMMIPRK